jgi:uncharacterized membrane protein YGL010W
MAKRTSEEWVREYSAGHVNSINRACHTVGIPMIVLSILLIPAAIWMPMLRRVAAGLFIGGWIFQFVGHAFERKAPEFFKDWRFLFVGVRWWLAKMSGKA